MRRLKFPIAVAVTSLALVLALAGIGLLAARSALANAPWMGPYAFDLPPELKGLHDLSPEERFGHFLGAQVNLKDKDNKPLAISATPGTATAVSATSLTIAANDGATKTFSLDDKTVIRGKRVQGGAQATQPTLAKDDKVVVMTIDGSSTATAVMVGGGDGFGPAGPHRFGPSR